MLWKINGNKELNPLLIKLIQKFSLKYCASIELECWFGMKLTFLIRIEKQIE